MQFKREQLHCEYISNNTKQITPEYVMKENKAYWDMDQSLQYYLQINFFQKNNDINQELTSVQHRDQLY